MDLTVRRMEEDDLGPLAELLSDACVMRHLEPPLSPERARAFLEAAGLADPPLVYAVEDGGGFAGYVIYRDYDETSVEIGWVLAPRAWGRGCATELTSTLLDWARSAERDVVIECVREQAASRRIAARFGFVPAGERDGLLVFRRPARCVGWGWCPRASGRLVEADGGLPVVDLDGEGEILRR